MKKLSEQIRYRSFCERANKINNIEWDYLVKEVAMLEDRIVFLRDIIERYNDTWQEMKKDMSVAANE